MILADTNIFIDFWNNPTEDLKNVFIPDWQILGDNLYNLRKKGISVPFSDAIIATIALKHGIPIWTGDRHFLLIQSVLTGLNIYQTPNRL